MTELQKHLMQLVKEIDETCRDNDLKYALYGRTAGNAMTEDHFTTSCYQFQIMMPAEDMLRLKELLLEKNIPNRGIEDMSVNKNLPHNRRNRCFVLIFAPDRLTFKLIPRQKTFQGNRLTVSNTNRPIRPHCRSNFRRKNKNNILIFYVLRKTFLLWTMDLRLQRLAFAGWKDVYKFQ